MLFTLKIIYQGVAMPTWFVFSTIAVGALVTAKHTTDMRQCRAIITATIALGLALGSDAVLETKVIISLPILLLFCHYMWLYLADSEDTGDKKKIITSSARSPSMKGFKKSRASHH